MITTLGLSPSLDVVYTVPAITAGAIHRPDGVHRLAGGKSLNVARALARLGVPVTAIAPLGGRIGDLVADGLRGSGVALERVETSTETRMCVTAADEQAHTLTEFYERGTAPDATAMAAVLGLLGRIEPGSWLTFSGAVPAGVDLPGLSEALADCERRGVRVAVDTHGPALGHLLAEARPSVVKVNRGEAAELTGLPLDAPLAALARAVQDAGGRVVVLTDGAAGSLAVDASGSSWGVESTAAAGRYPVGSGDSFLAGLVASLSRGDALDVAVAEAAACGTANAAVAGGAIFTADDLALARSATRVARLA